MSALLRRRQGLVAAATTPAVAEKLAELKRPPSHDAGKAPPAARQHVDGSANSAVAANEVHQADLLYMPNDTSAAAQAACGPGGAKYILVVVDLATRHVAALPLGDHASRTVQLAMEKIYRDDPVLNAPNRLEIDGGSELKGSLRAFLKRLKGPAGHAPVIRIGQPGRSKQQSLAENANQMIGDALTEISQARELATKKVNRQWVASLPAIVDALNEDWAVSPAQLQRKERKQEAAAEAHGVAALPAFAPGARDDSVMSSKLLAIGTRVYVRAPKAKPVNALGETEGGPRRSGDLQFSPEVRTVTNWIVTPGKIVLYRVSPSTKGNKGVNTPLVAYRRDELRPVKA